MISIIITAYKEKATIGKAILSIIENRLPNSEILVVAPDKETLDEAGKYKKQFKNLRLIKDKGLGKPEALNLAVSLAKGNVLILTDGDVFVSKNSLRLLIGRLSNSKTGAVSGHPVSINPIKDNLSFWAFMLTDVAHIRRVRAMKNKRRLFCSGYLFAIKKNLFPKLPSELLSEDAYISYSVWQKGFSVEYSEKSLVYVKYPTNLKDWIKQKKRSAGGYNQIKKMVGVEMRSFKKESLGFADFFTYTNNIKKLFWLFELFVVRVYLWFLIYKDINFKKKTREEIWQRVESTK